ncbi:MAG: hypothetical protein XD80_0810 [Synergistales bacterium 53_16]|nr:MAG: hypothetical protein XD80_0810 [Synergistales bacterium 53_16]
MTDGRTTSETLHEFVDVLREKNHEQQQALLDLLGVLKREREALAAELEANRTGQDQILKEMGPLADEAAFNYHSIYTR